MVDLKVVLFGMPGAGKTSLLGALWQAGQSQEQILGGKLSDPAGGLSKLQAGVDNKSAASYRVALAQSNGSPLSINLVESDVKPTDIRPWASLDADALLLLVDPSAGKVQLEKEFQQFLTFIDAFEKRRSHRNEVAGLPLFLVLTKCDLLKAADTGVSWPQRVAEWQRSIEKRLQESLAKNKGRASLPFGTVDVTVWATAVRNPTKSQEPFGVAELFHECFHEARRFCDQRQQAHGQLQAVLLGAIGIICILALAAGLFFISRPDADVVALENRIHDIMPSARPADLLKEPLEERLKKLTEIIEDPNFKKLPTDEQDNATRKLREMDDYQTASKLFQDRLVEGKVPDPKFARDEQDLKKIEKVLDQTGLPEEYQEAWRETGLGKKQQQFRRDIKNIREAVKGEEDWLQEMLKEGKDMRKKGGLVIAKTINEKDRGMWFDQTEKFIVRPNQRYKDTERLPDSPTISYGTVYRFRRLEPIQIDLANLKKNLTELRRQAQDQ